MTKPDHDTARKDASQSNHERMQDWISNLARCYLAQDEEVVALRKVIDQLRSAGRPMATFFYNCSQLSHPFDEHQRPLMKNMQRVWDGVDDIARGALKHGD